MGNGSVIVPKEKEKIREEKPPRDIEKDKKEVEKMIEQRRHISFTPIKKSSIKIEQNPNFNGNNKVITMNNGFRSFSSAPLKYSDNDALILTDYFEKINDNEKEEIEKMNYKFRHSFYQFNDYQDIEEISNIKEIKEKLNSEFGLMYSMKNDFEKMKTCLLYCPNLSNEDEKFINRLEFYDFLRNNHKYKTSILNIINKNEKEIPEFIAKLK